MLEQMIISYCSNEGGGFEIKHLDKPPALESFLPLFKYIELQYFFSPLNLGQHPLAELISIHF